MIILTVIYRFILISRQRDVFLFNASFAFSPSMGNFLARKDAKNICFVGIFRIVFSLCLSLSVDYRSRFPV